MVSTLNFTMWPQRMFGMGTSSSHNAAAKAAVASSSAATVEVAVEKEESAASKEGWTQSARQLEAMEEDDGSTRKRLRENEDGEGTDSERNCASSSRSGNRTPHLVSSRRRVQVGVNEHQIDHDDRPIKRFRGETAVVAISAPKEAPAIEDPAKREKKMGLLGTLPEDVLSHCLSFLNSTEDRFALQTTCKQFRQISNSDVMLKNIQVGGDRVTGKNGIIQEDDTPESAAVALAPFSRAGNLEAIYMLGMIKSYCHQDVETGIRLLKTASTSGYVRSSYALGLVLRDSQPEEANRYMKLAAGEGYLPALQELLPAREMKAKYGEPNADELRRHLDSICLNQLLGRHYVQSAELRELNTSHCWNPLCGRWAFKASVNTNSTAAARIRRPWGLAFHRNGNGEAQQVGTGTDNSVTEDNSASGIDNNSMFADAHQHANGTRQHNHDHTNNNHNNNDNSTTDAGPRAGPADADTRVDSSGTSDVSSSSQPRNQNNISSSASTDGNSSTSSTASSVDVRVSRMKMCSRCCRAKYCSKLCQVYDWRSGRHKMECQFL